MKAKQNKEKTREMKVGWKMLVTNRLQAGATEQEISWSQETEP